jgi:hypothetical protein
LRTHGPGLLKAAWFASRDVYQHRGVLTVAARAEEGDSATAAATGSLVFFLQDSKLQIATLLNTVQKGKWILKDSRCVTTLCGV